MTKIKTTNKKNHDKNVSTKAGETFFCLFTQCWAMVYVQLIW